MSLRALGVVTFLTLVASVSSGCEVTVHLLGDGEPLDAGSSADGSIEAMHVRADQALSSLMLKYWSTIASSVAFDAAYVVYWEAVLDAAERRGSNAFAGTARMFFELQGRRGWLDSDYRDESALTLALLHAYRVTGDSTYLNQAKVVYADVMTGWDATCCGSTPGGIWWKKSATTTGVATNLGAGKGKTAAVNSAAVIGGARLYEATHEATYLSFARQVFEYWSANMVDVASGHVYDNIQDDGTIDTNSHSSESEGFFIGAIVALARATGDTSQLPLAHHVAGYMMSADSARTPLGTILSDDRCTEARQMFKAIGARYLGELYAVDMSHTEYRDFLHRSADALWTLALDLSSGDISCDWAGPYAPAAGGVDSLGAAAVALAAAAEALGPAEPRHALTYEAEEADLHGVGLGNDKSGFSGWGYVVGFGSDGQSVDFVSNVPTAGEYAAAVHYSTGSNATRVVRVNGAIVAPSLAFASTGGYDAYSTVSVNLTLVQGGNTVTIAFANAQASGGFVNLDRMVLTRLDGGVVQGDGGTHD